MDSRNHRCGAALIGLAAFAVACAPDTSDRDGAVERTRDGSLSRSESRPPPTDSPVRPPTTAENPAAPGSAAAPAATPPPALTPRLVARAEIRPLEDDTVRGIVEFQRAAASDGPMTIHVMLMGLDAGPHGFHVHMGSDCAMVGAHLNPLNTPHGPANAASRARHLGDLGNITADASGMVEEMLRDSLLGGDASFVGKVLVVHEGQDDLSTQPDGDPGRPIGCGVIEAAGEDLLSRRDVLDRGA